MKYLSYFLCFGSFTFLTLVFGHSVKAGEIFNNNSNSTQDSLPEKKTDYIERIYFSGKNKEDLHTMILATLQEMNDKQLTTPEARQYVFLDGVKDQVHSCNNACDALEILAAGIYEIDVNAALKQGIAKPGKNAREKAGPGIDRLGTINTNAGNAAWTATALTGSNVTGKLAMTSYRVSQAQGLANAIKSIKIGGGKDKPCKNVAQKNIEIGEHSVPGINKDAPQAAAQQ